MAVITPVVIDTAGETVALTAAAAGGDTIATGGYADTQFIINNASGSTVTVTLACAIACSYGSTSAHNTAITVAAGTIKYVQVPANTVPQSGNVAVTYSAVTSVTVGAIAT
jgi:hypothetical protein